MNKHREFTRLPDESEASLAHPSIPLVPINSPHQTHVQDLTSEPQPHIVHLSHLRRGPISGVNMEGEWPVTELPSELRELDDDTDNRAANNTEANSMRNDWKRDLFLLLEDPSSSRAAFYVNVFVSFTIVLSAVLTTIETIPTFRSTSSAVWFNFETTIVVIFTIEYIFRVVAHSDSSKQLMRHVTAPLAVIDFIAIVPYYIELIFHHDTTYDFRFTILRLFRLLRVFKAFKYSSTIIMTIEVMIVAVKRSMDALGALFFFMVTSIVLFSTLLYFAERGLYSLICCMDLGNVLGTKKSAYLSTAKEIQVLSTAYHQPFGLLWLLLPQLDMVNICISLALTILSRIDSIFNLGDMVPTTFIGKVIAFPAMMCGILLIALPSIIVGRNFTLVWEAMRQYRRPSPNVREQADNVTLIGDNSSGYTMGNDRASFESTRSYASQPTRPGYSGLNDDIVANQDALLEQIRTLKNITQQNQVALQRIQQTLEQNGFNWGESDKPSVYLNMGNGIKCLKDSKPRQILQRIFVAMLKEGSTRVHLPATLKTALNALEERIFPSLLLSFTPVIFSSVVIFPIVFLPTTTGAITIITIIPSRRREEWMLLDLVETCAADKTLGVLIDASFLMLPLPSALYGFYMDASDFLKVFLVLSILAAKYCNPICYNRLSQSTLNYDGAEKGKTSQKKQWLDTMLFGKGARPSRSRDGGNTLKLRVEDENAHVTGEKKGNGS
ncbi:hypothetical protein G9A89_007607 [Geosiphon pyriformis]|nr:hypothetical protein G9A89_007607 [Geosiphon pyriformis]